MPHDEFTAAALIPTLQSHLARPRWLIAYSGGVDSHVLLHAIASLRGVLALPPLAALPEPPDGTWRDQRLDHWKTSRLFEVPLGKWDLLPDGTWRRSNRLNTRPCMLRP